MKQWQRYLAELFGTFVLVAGGSTAIIAALNVVQAFPYGTGTGLNAVELIVPFGFGLALLAALYMFAEVSGGHFNPAVSLGLFLDRRLSFEDLLGYWIFQFAGAIMASLLLLVPFNHDLVKATATYPTAGYGPALFLEITFTRDLRPGDPALDEERQVRRERSDLDPAHADRDPLRNHPVQRIVGEPGAVARTCARRAISGTDSGSTSSAPGPARSSGG